MAQRVEEEDRLFGTIRGLTQWSVSDAEEKEQVRWDELQSYEDLQTLMCKGILSDKSIVFL